MILKDEEEIKYLYKMLQERKLSEYEYNAVKSAIVALEDMYYFHGVNLELKNNENRTN